MAIRYADTQNKYLSGYVVSGKEADIVKKAILEKTSSDIESSIKRTSASVKAILSKLPARR